MCELTKRAPEAPTPKYIASFTPAHIRDQLQADLPTGLRMLADAIQKGEIDGRCISADGQGLMHQNWRDQRAHILVKLDIATQIKQER